MNVVRPKSNHLDNNGGNISNLFKAYSSNVEKFDETLSDIFDREYQLFEDRCEQFGINDDHRRIELSTMLCGAARQFYFDFLKSKNLELNDIIT